MTDYRNTEVDCQCGLTLFEYREQGKGRLIKCFLDQVLNSPFNLDGMLLREQ